MKQNKDHENSWAAIDLHVHTPASDDYQGPKDESEFLALLRRANEFEKSAKGKTAKRISCVAFTDHNSVEGIKRWRALYDKTASLVEAIREREPSNSLFKQLNDELELLKSIRILMGVEIKAYPGVHLLLIWHESVTTAAAENFLAKIYERSYEEVRSYSAPMTIWPIERVLDETLTVFGNSVFVVAPHIESDGGIHEVLKDLPALRMAVLKHPALRALSFNKIETRERVQALFRQPDYARRDPKPSGSIDQEPNLL